MKKKVITELIDGELKVYISGRGYLVIEVTDDEGFIPVSRAEALELVRYILNNLDRIKD